MFVHRVEKTLKDIAKVIGKEEALKTMRDAKLAVFVSTNHNVVHLFPAEFFKLTNAMTSQEFKGIDYEFTIRSIHTSGGRVLISKLIRVASPYQFPKVDGLFDSDGSLLREEQYMTELRTIKNNMETRLEDTVNIIQTQRSSTSGKKSRSVRVTKGKNKRHRIQESSNDDKPTKRQYVPRMNTTQKSESDVEIDDDDDDGNDDENDVDSDSVSSNEDAPDEVGLNLFVDEPIRGKTSAETESKMENEEEDIDDSNEERHENAENLDEPTKVATSSTG